MNNPTRHWDRWALAVIVIGIMLIIGSLELALWPFGTARALTP